MNAGNSWFRVVRSAEVVRVTGGTGRGPQLSGSVLLPEGRGLAVSRLRASLRRPPQAKGSLS